MAKYDGATVEVINWEKYNPRGDSKRPHWFRLENTLATGVGFFGLDCEQKWLWVFILSLVSQANGRPITWNCAYAQQLTGIKPKKQEETLEIFEKLVRLRVTREVTERDSPATYITNTTNITNEHNKCSPGRVRFEFESLYKKYPRKMGKAFGIKKAGREVTTPEDFDALSGAIDKFAAFHRAKGTEEKFIPYFSTFMTEWRDWLEQDTGTSAAAPSSAGYSQAEMDEITRKAESRRA